MLPETDRTRRQRWFSTKQQHCEVVIIGAGVVGTTIYRRLSEAGYKVVLIDRNDVGGGASQGSANLIWGGLLYLAKGRLDEVVRWSRARDALLAQPGVTPLTCSYRFDPRRRHPAVVRTALFAYWLLGGCRGPRPHTQHGAVHFREAILAVPDARWTWQQLAAVPAQSQSQVVTWCHIDWACRSTAGPTVRVAGASGAGMCWRLTLLGRRSRESACRAINLGFSRWLRVRREIN